MHRNTIAFVIVAAIGGFIGGFWLANSINRSAANAPTPMPNTTPAAVTNSNTDELTNEELAAKIAEADKNPTDFAYQKNLGISLYQYAASVKKDPSLLDDALRILERARSLKQDDHQVLVALGHAYFDIGFHREDAASFQKAREIYTKALELEPGDPDVATDLGISYFVQKPPDYDKAIASLTKVANANPRHDRSLQFLVQAYVKIGSIAEAEKALSKLKSINPNNRSIADLDGQIAVARQ